jgi:hypothetical protein
MDNVQNVGSYINIEILNTNSLNFILALTVLSHITTALVHAKKLLH